MDKKTKQETYRKRLNKECMYLTYKKTNGTIRTMYCTRSAAIIKSLGYKPVLFTKGRAYNQEKKYTHQLFVYDLDIGDVRIINLDTMITQDFADTYEKLLQKYPKNATAPLSTQPTVAPLSLENVSEKELDDIF